MRIMRTTVTLDADVAAAIEAERCATGESFRDALNRLVRRGLRRPPTAQPPPLPMLRGTPNVDITDVSLVLGELADEHLLDRGGP